MKTTDFPITTADFMLDADCELFHKILFGELCEDTYHDQERLLEEFMKACGAIDKSARFRLISLFCDCFATVLRLFCNCFEADLGRFNNRAQQCEEEERHNHSVTVCIKLDEFCIKNE